MPEPMPNNNKLLIGLMLVSGAIFLIALLVNFDGNCRGAGVNGGTKPPTADTRPNTNPRGEMILDCVRGSAPNVRVMIQPPNSESKMYPDAMRTVAMSPTADWLRVYRQGSGFVVVGSDGLVTSYTELQPGEVLTCVLGY